MTIAIKQMTTTMKETSPKTVNCSHQWNSNINIIFALALLLVLALLFGLLSIVVVVSLTNQ
jgi:hypothetical protein